MGLESGEGCLLTEGTSEGSSGKLKAKNAVLLSAV